MDYLFASVVAEVRRSRAKRPRDVKLSDCLVNFDVGAQHSGTEKDPERRMLDSKLYWYSLVGLDTSSLVKKET